MFHVITYLGHWLQKKVYLSMEKCKQAKFYIIFGSRFGYYFWVLLQCYWKKKYCFYLVLRGCYLEKDILVAVTLTAYLLLKNFS